MLAYAEAWCLKEGEKKRLNVFEMKCLRKICGVTVMDRIRIECVDQGRSRCGTYGW